MIRRNGGVPILIKSWGLNDDLFVARQSTDERFDFVIKDLEEVITLLPERPEHLGFAGRPIHNAYHIPQSGAGICGGIWN